DAEGPQHDAERKVEVEEHGALLDVQLQVRAGPRVLGMSVVHTVELHPAAPQGVLQPHAFGVAPLAFLVRYQRAPCRARAEQATPEPGAILICSVDEAHRYRRPAAVLLLDPPHDLEPGKNVQAAV